MVRLNRLLALALAGVLCLSLAGCERKPQAVQTTVFVMDTVMNLTLYGEQESLNRSVETLYELERQFSAALEDSPVARLNRGEGVAPTPELRAVLEGSATLSRITGGALDITAGPALAAWGFSTGEYRVPDAAELEGLQSRIGWEGVPLPGEGEQLLLPAGLELDLGGVAKGYAGDLLAEQLAREEVSSALLDLGQSSILAVGAKPDGSPWRIAVQDPRGESYLGVLELTDRAMGTSGDYQRYFERDGVRYCHIIDPATAAPARSGLMSVTVVADSCLVCDGLSTALFVMGAEEGARLWRELQGDSALAFEAIFVEENGAILVTAGLKDSFSLAEDCAEREVRVIE